MSVNLNNVWKLIIAVAILIVALTIASATAFSLKAQIDHDNFCRENNYTYRGC